MTLKVPCTNVEGSKCRYFRQLLLMFPCVLCEHVMKLATDNRSFEGQSAVLTEEFHVYLPQTRNSICYLLVQNCTSMPLIRQSRDNFINCSPYLSLDKTLFFPVCFILMTRKTKELYVTSFRRLYTRTCT